MAVSSWTMPVSVQPNAPGAKARLVYDRQDGTASRSARHGGTPWRKLLLTLI